MGTEEQRWLGLPERVVPLVEAGVVLGIGLGGFFDGIVLHQILQWHHLLSAHPDPAVADDLTLQVVWDGLFHAVTYAFTVAGTVLVWRASQRPNAPPAGRTLLGATIAGWGLFNLVEGLVNHHVLGLHHVWPAGPGGRLPWDLAFLAWGAAMVAVGYLLVRSDPTVAATRTADRGVRSE